MIWSRFRSRCSQLRDLYFSDSYNDSACFKEALEQCRLFSSALWHQVHYTHIHNKNCSAQFNIVSSFMLYWRTTFSVNIHVFLSWNSVLMSRCIQPGPSFRMKRDMTWGCPAITGQPAAIPKYLESILHPGCGIRHLYSFRTVKWGLLSQNLDTLWAWNMQLFLYFPNLSYCAQYVEHSWLVVWVDHIIHDHCGIGHLTDIQYSQSEFVAVASKD